MKDSKILRACHVIVFISYGVASTALVELGNLSGVLFTVYGVILIIQYRIFQKNFALKICIVIIIFGSVNVVTAIVNPEYKFPSGLPTAAITAMFVYLFWVVFAEEIKEYSKENSGLIKERDRNFVFVRFGKNIAGVIHNLKSNLMSVAGYIDIMRSQGSTKKMLDLQKASVERMQSVINNFMTAARSYQTTAYTRTNLSQLVMSCVEVSRGVNDIGKMRFSLDLGKNTFVYASPMEIMQIIDNLISNAAESMSETKRFEMTIITDIEDAFVRLGVSDQGAGIPFCDDCGTIDCMNCKHFAIGKSTKENGTGIGMIYIREILGEIGGFLRIESRKGKGTTVNVYFPAADKRTDMAIS